MMSTPWANTPPVDLSLVLFYYMLIETYKIVYQKAKIVVKATVHNESTVYIKNDKVKHDQQFNNTIIYKGKRLLKVYLIIFVEFESSVGFICADTKLFGLPIVFLLPCKHTQEEEFACFPENHRQAWKTPCRQCYASNCKKRKTIRKVFNFGWTMY